MINLFDKLDPKKTLVQLIKQEGFCNIAGTLGEVAKETEDLIRDANDRDLQQAFEIMFYGLMDCYKGAGKKNQKQIRDFMEIDCVKASLEMSHWESHNHCPAMIDACKTIKEWRLTNKEL